MKIQHGFTLIELIITLAVAAVVLTIGVPSFQEAMRNYRVTSVTNQLITALNLARSTAIKENVRVVLCKANTSTNTLPTACALSGSATPGYEQGWIVFVDTDNSGDLNGAEVIISSSEPASSGAVVITIQGNTNVWDYISFRSDGIPRQTGGGPQNGTITVCNSPRASQIIISTTGRIQTGATSC